MTNVEYGAVAGLALAVLAIVPMAKMTFADKRAAIAAAFVDRFMIGFLIATATYPATGWIRGVAIGFALSLPSALITRAYAPILILGTLGGGVIGFLLPRFVG